MIAAAIGTAALGAVSANKAAGAQKDAAYNDLQLQREIYDDTSQKFQPYLDSGNNALAAYNYEIGMGPRPTFGGSPLEIETIQGQPGLGTAGWGGGTPTTYRVGGQDFATMEEAQAYAQASGTQGQEYGGYTKTPFYDERLQGGVDALRAAGAYNGGVNSGSVLKRATEYGQEFAAGEYNNYLNRLSGVMSSGQNAAGQQAAAGQNYATGAGNAYANMGNAASAGAIGVNNALQSGIQNGISLYQYQQGLK